MGNKPLILEIEEAKTEIIQCVNNIVQIKQLPCYLLLPIIENIYRDVRVGAQNELEMAKEQMKQKSDEGVAEATSL